MSFRSNKKSQFPSFIEENVWGDSEASTEDSIKKSNSLSETALGLSPPFNETADFKCSSIELNENASFPLWGDNASSLDIDNEKIYETSQQISSLSSATKEPPIIEINNFDTSLEKTNDEIPFESDFNFGGFNEASEVDQEGFGEFEVFNDFENNQGTDFGDFSTIPETIVETAAPEPSFEHQKKQKTYETLNYLTSSDLDFHTRLSTFLSEIWELPNSSNIEELKKEVNILPEALEDSLKLNSELSSLQNELYRKIIPKPFHWSGSSIEAKFLFLNGVSQQTQRRYKKNLGNTFAPRWSFTLRPVKKNEKTVPIDRSSFPSADSKISDIKTQAQNKITSLEDFSAPVQKILKSLPVLQFNTPISRTSVVPDLIDPFGGLPLPQDHSVNPQFTTSDAAKNIVFNLLD